jgi:ribosomal protein L40E
MIFDWVKVMVFCLKCGAENSDNSKYCSNCGGELNVTQKEKKVEEWGEEFGKKMEKWGEDFGKRMEERGDEFGRIVENECFRLPRLIGAITGIIIGAFIVIIGAFLVLGMDFEVWGRWFGAGILIVIGLIIAIATTYGLIHRRR